MAIILGIYCRQGFIRIWSQWWELGNWRQEQGFPGYFQERSHYRPFIIKGKRKNIFNGQYIDKIRAKWGGLDMQLINDSSHNKAVLFWYSCYFHVLFIHESFVLGQKKIEELMQKYKTDVILRKNFSSL